MSKKPIYILGDGVHARVMADVIERGGAFSFQDFVNEKAEEKFLKDAKGKENEISLGLGIGENFIRKKLYERFLALGFEFPQIICPSAIISKQAQIEIGSFINSGAIINTSAKIGSACVVNSGAIIEHDVNIKNYAFAAPGSVISGGCTIGEGSFIGANATIIQNVNVGQWSVLGAGATLIQNLDDNVVAVGIPASIKKEKNTNTPIF